MDYTQLTDSELQEIFHAATEETSRRNLITAPTWPYGWVGAVFLWAKRHRTGPIVP